MSAAVFAASGLAIVAGQAEAQDVVVEPAGPWACEPPDFDAGPAPMLGPVELRLVAGMLLAAQETVLGIRPDQAEAWRDYAGALVAMVPSGDRVERWLAPEGRAKAEAFDLVQDVADAAIERADKAKRLKQSVDVLKATLTPEQMALVAKTQARLVERVARLIEWQRGESFGAPL
ncbi:hypothetical protein ACFSKM_06400 [Ancylobacter dichloromethanicus]